MKRILLALLCIAVFNACKKEKDTTPELPPIPKTTGNLSGKVNHYDQFGTVYTSGLNTTTVSIEGKGFKTVTNVSGYYTLADVPSGTYNLVFEKPGCGLIKRENIQYKFTDTVTYNAGIADLPVFTIDNAYAKDTTWFAGTSFTVQGIYYNATTNPVNSKASIVAIIGKSPNIDIANTESYVNYATVTGTGTTDLNRLLSYSLLKDTYNFKKDSIVYIRLYPVSTLASFYFNNKLMKPVYTAYGAAYPTTFSFFVK